MVSLKAASVRTQLIQKSLFIVAALGLMFPGTGTAQPTANIGTDADAKQVASRTILEDGIYLYGQASQRDVQGAGYAVFSVKDSQTVGAFYQPHSSFDCFAGQILPDRLAVNVVDSYEQTIHPYEIALTIDDTYVAGSAAGAYTLEGMHRIADVTESELNILSVCEADFAQ